MGQEGVMPSMAPCDHMIRHTELEANVNMSLRLIELIEGKDVGDFLKCSLMILIVKGVMDCCTFATTEFMNEVGISKIRLEVCKSVEVCGVSWKSNLDGMSSKPSWIHPALGISFDIWMKGTCQVETNCCCDLKHKGALLLNTQMISVIETIYLNSPLQAHQPKLLMMSHALSDHSGQTTELPKKEDVCFSLTSKC